MAFAWLRRRWAVKHALKPAITPFQRLVACWRSAAVLNTSSGSTIRER
jgi:hypothetical protein